jgi:hypothetical protein
MNKKMDIVFSPELKESPKLLITMKNFNHVYFGVYRGFDKDTEKEVIRYFWAEHNDGDCFFRCLVTKDHEINYWSLDSIANNLIPPMKITDIQREVLVELTTHMENLTTEQGTLVDKFNKAIESFGSPLLIVKDNDEEGFSIAEKQILATLNSTWRLDSSIEFEYV